MVSALPSATASPSVRPSPRSAEESDVLVLDAHTFKDLEIFESDTGGTTLFKFCNLTQNHGGAKALRERMERPWANPARIRATQEAIRFISAQRQAFNKLASVAYTAPRVERYAREILPVVRHENVLEFSIGALELWLDYRGRNFTKIVLGVQGACRLIRLLRRFLEQPELASPAGDLAPLFEEMRALLAQTRLSRIPDRQRGGWWAWRVLRIDQIFRHSEKAAMARLLRLICETDALVAMADVTRKHALVLPDIEQGPLRARGEGVVHPLLPNAVANPVELDQKRRLLFLTGPNMAGKTTYLRSFATALYMAHLGMGVPARSFGFVPAQRLFSSILLSDDLRGGISYFRAEALRVKTIAQALADGYRVVALLDEPFKGTNVKDALDASLAILERLAKREDCLFMFSSHLIELSEQLSDFGHVDCRYFEAEEGSGRLRFDYVLRPGVSSQRLGMRVLREEGIFELLDD